MPTSRSNQPRITRGAMNSQYHYAVEVAGQPAKTAEEKRTKKYADSVAKAFESRFPSLSERNSGGVTTTSKTVDKLYRPSK